MLINDLESLIGKTVRDVSIDAAHQVLKFVLDDGDVQVFHTDGGCCSHSWIEHVSNVSGLRGARVIGVEEVDLEAHWEGGEEDKGDFIRTYSAKLKIEDRPDFEIEYRNASNGYYGGSIERWGGYHTRGEPMPDDLLLLIEDF